VVLEAEPREGDRAVVDLRTAVGPRDRGDDRRQVVDVREAVADEEDPEAIRSAFVIPSGARDPFLSLSLT